MSQEIITLAFDRSPRSPRSVRRIDKDGRLHVEIANISKAAVNPYLGKEIPGHIILGLDPKKLYKMLRAPEELARPETVQSANNIQLLSKHIAVNARSPQKQHIAGSTGTDAVFEAPYLKNSLVVWDQDDIDDIESRDRCELSCSYHYEPDMTSGNHDGEPYDGVMRNIIFNHVALVEEGRAGHDVMVADSAMGYALDEIKHDPSNGQFSSGGGSGSPSGGGEKKSISKSDLKEKLEEIPHSRLMAALSHKGTDPAVKKMIEKELDERADRGSSKGHRETKDSLSGDSKENITMNTTAIATRALSIAALVGFIQPHLADPKKPANVALAFDGLPVGKGFDVKKLIKNLKSTLKTTTTLAADDKMGALAELLDMVGAAETGAKVENDESVSEEQHKAMEAAANGQSNLGIPEKVGAEFAKADKGKTFDAAEWMRGKGLSDDDIAEFNSMNGAEDEDEEIEVDPKKDDPNKPAAKDNPPPGGTQPGKGAAKDKAAKDKAAKDAAEKAEKEKDMVTKGAMDEALAKARAETRAEQRALTAAIKESEAVVGEIKLTFDSAEEVYAHVLKAKNVDIEDVPPAAYRAMVKMLPTAAAIARHVPAANPKVAMDAAGSKTFADKFPGAASIRVNA